VPALMPAPVAAIPKSVGKSADAAGGIARATSHKVHP
jgi:hypothetical protein